MSKLSGLLLLGSLLMGPYPVFSADVHEGAKERPSFDALFGTPFDATQSGVFDARNVPVRDSMHRPRQGTVRSGPGMSGRKDMYNILSLTTPFERSAGKETTTYAECIAFYKKLDGLSTRISIREMGMSDAGYPYHVVLYSNDGQADPAVWHRQHKLVVLINNGIHPGEPDGIDASMLLLRDLAAGKIKLADNVAIAVIPIYNIGGALNRGSYSRANQNGPESFGFRGNAQNLDLNRDFIKSDTRDAQSFARIFHWVDPEIQVDTHVSDGADYQHTMTLLCSQWNKLGGAEGQFLHEVFSPALFAGMEARGWPMCPYVNFEEGSPENGWEAFYDPPRYSSGYATLFHTIAFMPETHMLKPFRDRTLSTFALLQVILEEGSKHAATIITNRKNSFAEDLRQEQWPLHWKADTTRHDLIDFRGYEARHKTSDVTGQTRLYYDHMRPFRQTVKYYNYFVPDSFATAPRAYIIPQGWHAVIELLRGNGVKMERLRRDTMIKVESYHIDDYKSYPQAYEKHHRNYGVKLTASTGEIKCLKGDYFIPVDQAAKRFLVETLEPGGDDSYFSWNFFDGILSQKEWYSGYRWEDLAASYLQEHAELRRSFGERKKADTAFAANAEAQLDYVFKHSPYYEPSHLRYPVYRVSGR